MLARRRRFCNPRNPALLALLLGDKTNVVTMRKDKAVAIREEYHAFRNRAVWVMFFIPLFLFLGMRRADNVAADKSTHDSSFSLTPPLLTGTKQP